MDRIDLALLGDCDKIIEWIQQELEKDTDPATATAGAKLPSIPPPKQLFDEIQHIWAYEGANLDHKWIGKVQALFDEGSEGEEAPVDPNVN
jgi:hypothetical protein